MRGLTLVETLVALAVMGIGLTVIGLALPTLGAPETGQVVAQLTAARAEAVRSGHPVTVRVHARAFRFGPDGSASAGSLLQDSARVSVEPLTGEIHVSRQ